MNAAFLLVTTAWFAGDTGAAAPAPASSACCGTTCATCNDSCGCGGHKLLDKLRGSFKHHGCDTCNTCSTCNTCAAPCSAPCPAPKCAPAPTCCETKCHTHHHCKSCNTCDTCSSGPKLLDRLRACFHHEKACGCDGGCSTCSSCGTGACGSAAPPSNPAEPIPAAPKKMPSKDGKQVSTDAPSAFSPVPATIEISPNAGQAPQAVPSIESDNLRNPF